MTNMLYDILSMLTYNILVINTPGFKPMSI